MEWRGQYSVGGPTDCFMVRKNLDEDQAAILPRTSSLTSVVDGFPQMGGGLQRFSRE